METWDKALALATDLAQKEHAGTDAAGLEQIRALAANPEELALLIRALQDRALARLDQMPNEACRLGRIAHALAAASLDPVLRAESALNLAIALNRLGEFGAVLPLAEQAASFLAPSGESDLAARSLCEGAWADSYIGNLDSAVQKVTQARSTSSSSLVHARADWVQARVCRSQASYERAATLFEKAAGEFRSAGLLMESSRCERELAHVNILRERGEVPSLLERLRATFLSGKCLLDASLCDYFLAIHLQATSHYRDALALLVHARQSFLGCESPFFAAWCDLISGIVYRQLNRFEDSFQVQNRARSYFLSHGIRTEISACDINLGNTYYALNRYDEAMALYQEAIDYSLAEGREARAGRLYNNMGLVYAKQGRFSQALDLHHRALQIFESKGLAILAAGSHFSLVACYRQLGQYDQALEHLECARRTSALHHLDYHLVQCMIDLGEIHLARDLAAAAAASLAQALEIATANEWESFIAVCDRLLAQAAAATSGKERALAWISEARRLFAKHAQRIDVALCDLAEGELHLQWNDIAAAQECLERARTVLSPGFPGQAWRADYGLGRCAQATRGDVVALDHYLRAVRTIAASRSALVTEQLSNDFFAHRQSVFDDALSTALKLDDDSSALEIVEASKGRTFLTLLQNRAWRLPQDRGDPYIADLVSREQSLRYQLQALRRRTVVQAVEPAGEPLRGQDALAAISDAALDELNATSSAYEAVVNQLRWARSGLAGVSVPAPFALSRFREAAHAAFGADWTALDYYLSEDTLTIAVVGPTHLHVEQKTLTEYDRAILEDCTSADPDSRELVYRGTLSQDPVPGSGMDYLRHLHRLLIPAGLSKMLIVSAHGALHALPFHALISPHDQSYLVEHHTIIYSPNLQSLQALLADADRETVRQPLILGVPAVDSISPLAFAEIEANLVRDAFDRQGRLFWGEQATRAKLLELNASGDLWNYDIVHIAAHAILDRAAPHQSSILLSDGPLTMMDILDLSLNARLVTLSACQTALSEGGRGDELIGLVRALFYAGSLRVMGALWHVEDRSTAELMGRFYRYAAEEETLAAALRRAQVEMIHAGQLPYQWAPFMLIGRP